MRHNQRGNQLVLKSDSGWGSMKNEASKMITTQELICLKTVNGSLGIYVISLQSLSSMKDWVIKNQHHYPHKS